MHSVIAEDKKTALLQIILLVIPKQYPVLKPQRTILDTISNIEYDKKFGNLKTYLAWYLQNTEEFPVFPEDSTVQIYVRRKNRGKGLEVLCLQ